MQVILLEKVVNLGDLGDVVRVRNGYARNFLIPKKWRVVLLLKLLLNLKHVVLS